MVIPSWGRVLQPCAHEEEQHQPDQDRDGDASRVVVNTSAPLCPARFSLRIFKTTESLSMRA